MNSVFFRAFEEEDALLINKWRNDPELQMLTGGNFRYVSLEMEKNWVKQKALDNKNDIYLAICLNDEGYKMIGYLSFNKIDYINRHAEIGGLIIGDKDYRDGIIWVECSLFIMQYGFETLNLNRLYGTCLTEHKLTTTMFALMFWNMEGICKQAVFKRGSYHDIAIYSLLLDNYRVHNANGSYEWKTILKRLRELRK